MNKDRFTNYIRRKRVSQDRIGPSCTFPDCDCDLTNNGKHQCPKQEKTK
jgi:hypothetical protein